MRTFAKKKSVTSKKEVPKRKGMSTQYYFFLTS